VSLLGGLAAELSLERRVFVFVFVFVFVGDVVPLEGLLLGALDK